MAAIKWLADRASQPISILTTGLDALANGSAALSSAIANDSAADLYVDLEWFNDNAFGAAPTDFAPIEAWIARMIDGTNYEDATAGASPVNPRNGYAGSFFVRNITGDQRMIIPMILLPPRDFKVQAVNKSGQTFPATLNTIKGYFYKEQAA